MFIKTYNFTYCVLLKTSTEKNPHKVAQDFSSQKRPAHKTCTRLYLGKVCWAPKVAGSSAQDTSTRAHKSRTLRTRRAQHPHNTAHKTFEARKHFGIRTRRAHKTERTRLRTRPSAQDNQRRQRKLFSIKHNK